MWTIIAALPGKKARIERLVPSALYFVCDTYLVLPQTAGCDHSAECAGHNEPRGDSLSERVHSQGDEGKKDEEAKPGNSHHNSMCLSF